MPFIQRANVILEVPEDSIDYYLDRGYNMIDANGKVLQEAVPTDLGTLKSAYVSNKKLIEEKNKQIIDLQNEVKLLTSQLKAAKKKQQ